jgi:hypothetical protein
MKAKNMKRPKAYPIRRIFLETLEGYVEASRCKTLDQFERDKKP